MALPSERAAGSTKMWTANDQAAMLESLTGFQPDLKAQERAELRALGAFFCTECEYVSQRGRARQHARGCLAVS